MYEGGLRVPFVIKGPGISRNSYSDVPVTGLDILPTLQDWQVITVHYKNLDGGNIKNIITIMEGKVERSPYLIFHQAANRKPIALRFGKYKLVKDWRYNNELFNLSEDIEEKVNLSKKMPNMVKKLNQALIKFLKDANAEKTNKNLN